MIGLEYDEGHPRLLNDAFQGNVFRSTQFSVWMSNVMGLQEGNGDRVVVDETMYKFGDHR